MELRCPNRIHGITDSENRLEVKCSSKRCGAGNGTVVLHYFDLSTGKCVQTKKFRDPAVLFNDNKTTPKEERQT